MEDAYKNGQPQNVTLQVPPFKEVENQIIGVKFSAFREYYRIKVGLKYVIKVRDLKPNRYFVYDPDFEKIIFVLSSLKEG
jgi:hypothetical protein